MTEKVVGIRRWQIGLWFQIERLGGIQYTPTCIEQPRIGERQQAFRISSTRYQGWENRLWSSDKSCVTLPNAKGGEGGS